jgi:Tol biopolymer transport system component
MAIRSSRAIQWMTVPLLVLATALVACQGSGSSTSPRAASSGGHLVWGRYDPGGLAIMTSLPDGSGQTQILTSETVEEPRFSPDGAQIAMAVDGADRVTTGIAAADGTGFRGLTVGRATFSAACVFWSPDGGRLACEAWEEGHPAESGVYTVRASDGGGLRRLTRGGMPCGWSPDGTQLAYLLPQHGDENRSLLYVVPSDGTGQPQRIGSELYSGLWCDWSPVDQTILTEQDGSLWIVALDGTRSAVDLQPPAGGSQASASRPSFSPDGGSVIFSMDVGDGQTDIYTARIDGSDLRQITATPQGEEFADWGS